MSIVPLIDIYKKTTNLDNIFDLLGQLTSAPSISKEQLEKFLFSLHDNHQIFAYIKDAKIVGLITLLIEPKLIHGGACTAHIEDLVVDCQYRGFGIATELINFCIKQTRERDCYKIILACKRDIVDFYEKNGFIENNIQMAKYF